MVNLGPGQALVPIKDYLEMLFGYKTQFLGWVAFILTGAINFLLPTRFDVARSCTKFSASLNLHKWTVKVLLDVQVTPLPLLLPPSWPCNSFDTKNVDGS